MWMSQVLPLPPFLEPGFQELQLMRQICKPEIQKRTFFCCFGTCSATCRKYCAQPQVIQVLFLPRQRKAMLRNFSHVHFQIACHPNSLLTIFLHVHIWKKTRVFFISADFQEIYLNLQRYSKSPQRRATFSESTNTFPAAASLSFRECHNHEDLLSAFRTMITWPYLVAEHLLLIKCDWLLNDNALVRNSEVA